MIKTIFTHYKSLIASLIWLFIVYASGRGYIDADTAKLLSESCVLIFWAVNISNHMKR